MNLYLRFLIVLLASVFRKRIADILQPANLRLRVLPNDLDLNGHMNNGRYPSLMDLGRLDMVLRSGLLKLVLKQKSVPVLAALQMRFRLPLKVFQPFDLQTRVLCWDEKWVYMEQRFVIVSGEKSGHVAAIALVKGGFFNRADETMVPTKILLDAVGMNVNSPAFPDSITSWIKAEESLRAVTRA